MEKIKFRDVAHYYLGCKCKRISEIIFTLSPINFPSSWESVDFTKNFKPILRPLSSMSDEDVIGFCKLSEPESYWNRSHERIYDEYRKLFREEKYIVFSPEETHYLISKHYDVFGLIDSGEAIDGSALEGFKF